MWEPCDVVESDALLLTCQAIPKPAQELSYPMTAQGFPKALTKHLKTQAHCLPFDGLANFLKQEKRKKANRSEMRSSSANRG